MSGFPQSRLPRRPAERRPSEQRPSEQPRSQARAPVRLALGLIILAVALLAVGTIPRLLRASRVNRTAEETRTALPVVAVTQPTRVVDEGLSLPGNIEGARQTTVQARTSGYIQKIRVDIGSQVKAGDVLAEIASPELDQQVLQAQAQTAQAQSAEGQAQAELAHARQQVQVQRAAVIQQRAQVTQAQLNFQRSRQLWGQGLLSRQDAETALTALRTSRATLKSAESAVAAAQADVGSAQKGVKSAQAAVAAARANARRYAVLRSFEKVTAPFDGVITARNVDEGALINASGGSTGGSSAGVNAPAAGGSGPASSTGLFQIANSDTVKINVQIPQTYALSVQAGGRAAVTVRELPGQTFDGTINLRAGALDPASRTMEAEIDIPNRSHILLPGMYAQVRITPSQPRSTLHVPDSAVLMGAEGTRVAVLTPDNRVHFQPVETGRDFGTEMEVLTGIQEGQRLVDNPPATLREGDAVSIMANPPAHSGGPAGAGGPSGADGGRGGAGGGKGGHRGGPPH